MVPFAGEPCVDVAPMHRRDGGGGPSGGLAGALVEDDTPDERPFLASWSKTGRLDQGVDARVGVQERAVPDPSKAEPRVEERDRPPEERSIAGQHEPVQRPSPCRRQADQRVDVGIAADHPVEGHDVGHVHLGCPRHEVAVHEGEPVERPASTRLAAGCLDSGWGGVDQHGTRGAGAAIVMPRANTQAMQHHLEEIARSLAPKVHAVIVLDQAGWHTTGKLRLPENLSLLPLPSKSPELNPVENVWQFLRQNKLSNRIFGGYEAIVTAACDAWNSLIADPARITSIGTRQWATIARS